jgi:hypothetical protein
MHIILALVVGWAFLKLMAYVDKERDKDNAYLHNPLDDEEDKAA